MKKVQTCAICSGSDLTVVWALPALPMTECFGPYNPSEKLSYDQALLMCRGCGHFQLQYQISSDILYTQHAYAYRTGSSKSRQAGVEFFLDFLNRVAGAQRFASAVDVGGNDLYLARRLEDRADRRAVVDPICKEIDGTVVDGIHAWGRMAESIDFSRDTHSPDLIVCRHTLEHIARPRDLLNQLFDQCADHCLYVFEIPCFENLMEAQRFDAVFHQHYQYYDLSAFRRLLTEAGGEYITHVHNRQGSCGGALLIAFRKSKVKTPVMALDLTAREHDARKRIDLYEKQMSVMTNLLTSLPRPIFGYGAGLMLSTLAYHLKTDLNMIDCVLDDDPGKDGWSYRNIPVKIKCTQTSPPPPQSSYIVTSMENVRPICRRIADFSPGRILVPNIL